MRSGEAETFHSAHEGVFLFRARDGAFQQGSRNKRDGKERKMFASIIILALFCAVWNGAGKNPRVRK